MTLHIDINDPKLTISLKLNRKVVDTLSVRVDRDLDSKLIPALDKLFKRNKMNKLSLKNVQIAGQVDKNSSYYRILSAFKKGLKFQ